MDPNSKTRLIELHESITHSRDIDDLLVRLRAEQKNLSHKEKNAATRWELKQQDAEAAKKCLKNVILTAIGRNAASAKYEEREADAAKQTLLSLKAQVKEIEKRIATLSAQRETYQDFAANREEYEALFNEKQAMANSNKATAAALSAIIEAQRECNARRKKIQYAKEIADEVRFHLKMAASHLNDAEKSTETAVFFQTLPLQQYRFKDALKEAGKINEALSRLSDALPETLAKNVTSPNLKGYNDHYGVLFNNIFINCKALTDIRSLQAQLTETECRTEEISAALIQMDEAEQASIAALGRKARDAIVYA